MSDPAPKDLLAYDVYTPAKSNAPLWHVIAFASGIEFSSLAYALFGFLLDPQHDGIFPRVVLSIVPIFFGLLVCLPAMLCLGLSLWLKRKIFKEVRYSRTRTALLWGIACGLYPYALCQFFPCPQNVVLFMFLGALAWYVILPSYAGMLLCRHSHLRD